MTVGGAVFVALAAGWFWALPRRYVTSRRAGRTVCLGALAVIGLLLSTELLSGVMSSFTTIG